MKQDKLLLEGPLEGGARPNEIKAWGKNKGISKVAEIWEPIKGGTPLGTRGTQGAKKEKEKFHL